MIYVSKLRPMIDRVRESADEINKYCDDNDLKVVNFEVVFDDKERYMIVALLKHVSEEIEWPNAAL